MSNVLLNLDSAASFDARHLVLEMRRHLLISKADFAELAELAAAAS